MALTDSLLRQFRKATGDLSNPPSMSATEIEEDYFAEALTEYPDDSDRAHLAYAVLKRLNELLVAAAGEVSYSANSVSESLSDKALRYRQAIEVWQKNLDDALANGEAEVPVYWGKTVRHPRRDKDYPDDHIKWSG